MKKSRAIEVLKKQLDEIPALKKVREGDKKYRDWKTQTLAVIKSVFGEWSTNYKEANDSLFLQFLCLLFGNLPWIANIIFQFRKRYFYYFNTFSHPVLVISSRSTSGFIKLLPTRTKCLLMAFRYEATFFGLM